MVCNIIHDPCLLTLDPMTSDPPGRVALGRRPVCGPSPALRRRGPSPSRRLPRAAASRRLARLAVAARDPAPDPGPAPRATIAASRPVSGPCVGGGGGGWRRARDRAVGIPPWGSVGGGGVVGTWPTRRESTEWWEVLLL